MGWRSKAILPVSGVLFHRTHNGQSLKPAIFMNDIRKTDINGVLAGTDYGWAIDQEKNTKAGWDYTAAYKSGREDHHPREPVTDASLEYSPETDPGLLVGQDFYT